MTVWFRAGAVALLLAAASSAAAQVAPEENVGPSLLSQERIAALAPAKRDAWQRYLERSAMGHARDTAAMNAELRALHAATMTKAPYRAPDFRYGEREPVWFASDGALSLVTSVLSWQTPSGGWSKRTDMSHAREPGMAFYSETESWHYTPTFDNGSTTGQLRFLAQMVDATGNPSYAKAFSRGLALIFDAQQPNGCWPQTYPLEGGYHDAVTFNDDVTVLILRVLDDVASGKWEFVTPEERRRAVPAAQAGVSCLVRAQVRVNRRATVWGQQHDPITLEIVPARRYELAGLAGRESASIMKYLMSLPHPDPGVVNAVHAAAAWFEGHAVHGFRYGGYDLTRDSSAGPLWPRLTEISTDRPIFANRDGRKLYDWNQLTDRRSGYGWFGNEPAAALDEYRTWSHTHPRSS